MNVVKTIGEMREQLRRRIREGSAAGEHPVSVGFVPTMGYLHEGHASLLRRARAENDVVVLSVFVNPTQFGPNEDFDRYPRDEARDVQIAREHGVDFVFMPTVAEMYPEKPTVQVTVSGGLTDKLCGKSRPGHFDGVATVVTKLFQIVKPHRAYFGMKDAQQVAVIRKMCADLNIDVEIVPCPTVREPDGLALSSRNVYLSPEERRQALVLYRALEKAGDWLRLPGMTLEELRERVAAEIRTAPLAVIDYVELVTFPSLLPADRLITGDTGDTELLLALAVKFGATRLIDNRLFSKEEWQTLKQE